MTPYNYFSSKADLMWHLKNDVLRELLEEQKASVSEMVSARDQMLAATRNYFNYWLSKPEKYRLMYIPHSLSGDEILTMRLVSEAVEKMREFQDHLSFNLAQEIGGKTGHARLATKFRHASAIGIIHLHFVNPALIADMTLAVDAYSTLLVNSVEDVLKREICPHDLEKLIPKA